MPPSIFGNLENSAIFAKTGNTASTIQSIKKMKFDD